MKKIITVILIILLISAIAFFFNKVSTENGQSAGAVTQVDPLDIVLGFYNDWFDELKSTSSDPYIAGLMKSEVLTESVQTYITATDRDTSSVFDPVLCFEKMPPRIGAKEVYKLGTSAQYTILPRGVGGVSAKRAIVDLQVIDNEWKISNIECVDGESVEDREFTFERSGYILKSDEEPLTLDSWYLIFEENGKEGHHAPLFFDASSMCEMTGESESVCDESRFTNPSPAAVKGNMTESGVNVKWMKF